MASALGARVQPGQREVGFFEVTLDPISQYDPLWRGIPAKFVATHWHGDVFDIPPGGMRLASSALTRNQLFRYGHALYGLQFHLEMTPGLLEEAVARAHGLLIESGVDADMIWQQGQECLPVLRETASTVFTSLGGVAVLEPSDLEVGGGTFVGSLQSRSRGRMPDVLLMRHCAPMTRAGSLSIGPRGMALASYLVLPSQVVVILPISL